MPWVAMLRLSMDWLFEEEIKLSRFIACAGRVDSAEQAMAFVSRVRQPEANHNCWAYKVESSYRFSDDGEPGGTAGRPILAAIEGLKLDHVAVVVSRYFGGIKLGAGGLVRAYGGTAAKCLRAAPKVDEQPVIQLLLQAPFECLGEVYAVIERVGARKCNEAFTQQGVELVLELQQSSAEAFGNAVRDATRARARLTPVPPPVSPA